MNRNFPGKMASSNYINAILFNFLNFQLVTITHSIHISRVPFLLLSHFSLPHTDESFCIFFLSGFSLLLNANLPLNFTNLSENSFHIFFHESQFIVFYARFSSQICQIHQSIQFSEIFCIQMNFIFQTFLSNLQFISRIFLPDLCLLL